MEILSGTFEIVNQGWIGSLLGITGIIVGIYLYKISKKTPIPVYQYWSFRILGKVEDNFPKDVSVKFREIEVDRLTRTTVIFWNDGTQVLNGSDIVKTDPSLIFYPEGSMILSSHVLRKTKNANDFRIEPVQNKPNVLSINFEYLDPKDGATCEIVHDSQEHHPKISGSIRGIPSGFRALGKGRRSEGPKGYELWIWILTSVILIMFGVIIEYTDSDNDSGGFIFVVMGIIYAILLAFILWTTKKSYPKNLDISDDLP